MLLVEPLPRGTPADAATTAAITAVIRELEACVNAGEYMRFSALFSAAWYRQIPLSDEIVAESTALAAATPMPVPEGQRGIFSDPWHVEKLADGRVLAAVIWVGREGDPNPDPTRAKVVVFVKDDGRWLIDELIERVADCEDLAAVVGPPPGTPPDAWPKRCRNPPR